MEEDMSSLSLPPPEGPGKGNSGKSDSGAPQGSAGSHRERGRGKASKIHDVDACLSALSALPGLVAMGMVSPSQANAISRVYSTILQHHQKTAAVRDQGVRVEGELLDLLRADPRLVNLLEPLLTDEQMEAFFRSAGDGTDAKA
jgi:hypothetical protein